MSAVTENNYTGNGSTTNYNFTFPYLKTSDVQATLDGVATTNFTFVNATTIQFNNGATPPVATAPANGVKIKILRSTGVENAAATFYAGSAIKSEDLNENFAQTLFITQEVNERYLPTTGGTFTGALNLGDNKITNLADPVDPKDAVNKQTLDSTIETDVLAGTDLSKTASNGQVTINHNVTGANTNINNTGGNVIQDINITDQGHVTSVGSVDLDTLYFRQDSSETIASGNTWTASDSYIATTGAIDARIIDLVDEVGGFNVQNDEQSFPNTNPQGATGQSAVLSIKAATTDLVPTGTTVTITNGNVGNNANITITGVSGTILQGFGFLVESTATLHTYTFHRLVPKATEVTTVASNITNINNVGSNIANVNAANNNITDISTVAGSIANVNTVGTNIGNVNIAANNINDINNFAETYRIVSSDPTTSLDTGDLIYNTTVNKFKVYNGTGWEIVISGGIDELSEDQTPQLGGDLDVQGRKITTSAANANIKVEPTGSGVFEVRGAGGNDGTLQLNCSAQTHGVKIKSPPHSASASYTLTLPNNTGTADQILKTDGTGVLSFSDAASGLVGSSNEKLFVEAENAMDNDFTTTTGNNYVSASPLTLNATLTVVSGSTMSFV